MSSQMGTNCYQGKLSGKTDTEGYDLTGPYFQQRMTEMTPLLSLRR